MLRAQVSTTATATGIELLPGEACDLTVCWQVDGSVNGVVGDWRLVVNAVVNTSTHSQVLIAFTSGLASITSATKSSFLDTFLKMEVVSRPDNNNIATHTDTWCSLDVRVSYTPGLRSLSFDLEAVSSADIDYFRQVLIKDRTTSPTESIYTHK
jgi:hypothetical protein